MNVPEWIEDVFYHLFGELTYDDGGRPITIPVGALYDADKGSLIVSTSISFYHKVRCIKHNHKVALNYGTYPIEKIESSRNFGDIHRRLYEEKPVVLVYGEAIAHEEDLDRNRKDLVALLDKQKDSMKKVISENQFRKMTSTFGKIMFDWYMKRILIEVKPQKILAWQNGNLDEKPEIIGVK